MDDDPLYAVIPEGGARWTVQRPGETPSEAMNRLTIGEDIDVEGMNEAARKAMEAIGCRSAPRFGRP